jgi:hypothetical protein
VRHYILVPFLSLFLSLTANAETQKSPSHKPPEKAALGRPAADLSKPLSWDELKVLVVEGAKKTPGVQGLQDLVKELLKEFTESEWKELDQISRDYERTSEAKPFDEKEYRSVLERQHALFRKIVKRAGFEFVDRTTKDNEFKADISKDGRRYRIDMATTGITVRSLADEIQFKLSDIAPADSILPTGKKISDEADTTFKFDVMLHSHIDAPYFERRLRDSLDKPNFYIQLGYSSKELHKKPGNLEWTEMYVDNDGFYAPVRKSLLDAFAGSRFNFSSKYDHDEAMQRMHLNTK